MEKPQKTLADYVAVAISPALIMLLVGSLAFFLIQVFYRGEMVHGVRWTMFWFVVAIVLVSRIGIQRGKRPARWYGAALAVAAWIYLDYTHQTPVLGAILLAITWWCAHRLTVDCTLIREDDAAGDGGLENLWGTLGKQFAPRAPKLPPLSPLELLAAADLARRRAQTPARPAGRWVVYFSLAALPLFGIGQLFLPADDSPARHAGFMFLVLYLGAAFSLLVTTSFLGLRRFLRQRSVEIPASVTAAWIKFGTMLAVGVLLLALILPRPGGMNVWKSFTYRIPHKEHKAAEYALPFNSPGQGQGARTEQPAERPQPSADFRKSPPGSGAGNARNNSPAPANSRRPSDQPGSGGGSGSGDQGNSGQGSGAGSGQPSNISLKDNTPPGNSDQASDKKTAGGTDEIKEPDRDGPEHQRPNIKVAQDHSQPGKESQRKPAKPPAASTRPVDKPEPPLPPDQKQGEKQPSDFLYRLLRALLILTLAAFLAWLLVRFRTEIAKVIRKAMAAVSNFFQRLFRRFHLRRRRAVHATDSAASAAAPEPFMAYENPFLTGNAEVWPPDHLLRYTYQAVQAWAKEQGIESELQETPREFCARLGEHFPDIGSELEQFSIYCTHAAFAQRLPDDLETQSIRRLWEYLGDSVTVLTEAKR